jgi:RNA polymerase-binding transcription factor DksA
MTLEAEGLEEVVQIDHALQRLNDGSYLSCSKCGGEIGEQRLEIIPYTDQCISCAS